MHSSRLNTFGVRLAILATAVILSLPTVSRAAEAGLAGKLGIPRGVCVVLGDRTGEQALVLASTTELTVLVQCANHEEMQAVAKKADAAGLLGRRLFVASESAARIALADNVADGVMVIGQPAGLAEVEVLRVLRPGGKVVWGRKELTKPVPVGVDDWSHHYHGPDNNPQSRDQLARAPYLTQFIAEPRYGPAPQAAVAAGGRIFMAFGHVAWHEREEPVLNTLIAMNGNNGTILWQRPLKPGIMVDRSTMIATPTTLYLADDESCKLLDTATGKVQDEIIPPAGMTDGPFWKWMALENGILYALVGKTETPDAVARWRRTNHGWPWNGISKGYNAPDYEWGFAKTLLAIDPRTKKVLWSHREEEAIDCRGVCLKNGRIYISSFGKYLACLDAKTGRDLWRRTVGKDKEVFEAIGPYRPGHGYIEGWKTTVYLKCTDQALYFVGPQVAWLTALSAKDGHVLWKHPAKDLHVVIRDDGLYTIAAQNKPDDTKKLDPMTGQILASFPTRRRACTRSTGSMDSIFFRAHEGSGRFDTGAGKMQWISAVRPSCHVGVVVANGQLYWLPWTCDCNLQVFGVLSLGPAGKFDFEQPATDAARLERFVPAAAQITEFIGSPDDWPAYRANNARSAQTSATVPDVVRLLWKFDRTLPDPTAPIAAAGMVYLGAGDGGVRALDAQTGKTRWTSYTGGALRFPPALAAGQAVAGSDDGYVYAFEAQTGRLRWRFQAAPVGRRMPVFGSLISTWPVGSGVLAAKGAIYFAAGLNDLDGTHVYALDPVTGQIKWQNSTSGHLDEFSRRGVACQGEILLHDGKLYLAGGNSVSPGVFDAATGRCLNQPPGGMGTTARRGRELRLVGGNVAVSGQPLYSRPEMPVFDGACKWEPMIVSARNARLSLLERQTDQDKAWALVAKKPDGADLWTQPLPAAPVRWGIAVDAAGRITVSLQDGQVLCFGK